MINTQMKAIIFFVLLILIGRTISLIPRRRSFRDKGRDIKRIFKDYTAVVASLVPVLGLSVPIIEFYQYGRDIKMLCIIPGSIIVILGFMLNALANKEINKNWSPILRKYEHQLLVKTGVYSIIRHPLYTSGLLIVIGACIYFRAMYSYLPVVIYFIIIIWRIRYEEKELIERFGSKYLEYIKDTKKILPFVY